MKMKLLSGVVIAAALSAAMAANAAGITAKQKPSTKKSQTNEIMVGSGLVCDTKQQAERFVSLMGDSLVGEEVEKALATVNGEAGQSDACVMATVGFFPGRKVAEIEKNGMIVNVIEVLVLAVGTPDGLKVIEPKMYYSVVQTKDRIT